MTTASAGIGTGPARGGARSRATALLLAGLALAPACAAPHHRLRGGPEASRVSEAGFASPVAAGRVSSSYGSRGAGRRRYFHRGVDITTGGAAVPVLAAREGSVSAASRNRTYGLWVEIDHAGGWTTRYAHLSRLLVRRGQRVPRGAPLGLTGSSGRASGVHLHFEVLRRVEEVMGKNGTNAVLNLAGLGHLIDNYPPNNLNREFDFADFGALARRLTICMDHVEHAD